MAPGETADIELLTDPEAVPRGPRYAYHETRARNRDGIIHYGITPQDRGPAGSEADALLHEHDDGYTDRPQHRSQCVFLYPDADRGMLPAIEASNVCFVIDLTGVHAPMYTADFDLASDMYGVVSEDEIPETARKYWESCRSFTVGETPSSEILIEGVVPPTAITHCFESSPSR